MGSLWPMTPVLITMLRLPLPSSSSRKHDDAFSPIAVASSMPPLPVTALAQPELMIMDLTPRPPRFSSMALLTCTGAAWNLFFVNTAAAEHGCSDAMKARSGYLVFDGLTPTWVPETRKPFGYVPEVGTYFCFAAGIELSSGAE